MIELVDVQIRYGSDAGWTQRGPFAVPGGQVGVVIASAASGSSQLLRCLYGEQATTRGATTLFGFDTQKLRRSSLRKLRRRVGYLPQSLTLLDEQDVLHNIALPLYIDGVRHSQALLRAALLAERVGVAEVQEVQVGRLSPSLQQRVALARALVRDPQVLLLDQPTSAQDPAGTALLCEILAAFAATGGAVLTVTRDAALYDAALAAQWATWCLAGGSLHSTEEVALDTAAVEAMLVTIESAPVKAKDRGVVSGPMRLPISAPLASVS